MFRSGINAVRLLAALVLLAALAVVPQLAAAATPKDGGYGQSDSKRGVAGYIATSDGKVVAGGGYLTFKATGGGKCKSNVIKPYTNKGVTGVNATPKKPGKVEHGKFEISSGDNGFETTISGRFKSKKKAMLMVESKVEGCSAKATFKNAKYTAGG